MADMKLAEFYYDLFEVRELISETAGKLYSYKKLLLSPIMCLILMKIEIGNLRILEILKTQHRRS